MKKIIIVLLLSIVNCQLSFCQIGTWRNYLAYSEIQQIQEAGNELFVLASGGLYLYNKQDNSIHTFDKTNGMNDIGITHIKWCQQAKRLVIIYSNCNIDLMDLQGNVINISDIYSKAITGEKSINSVYVNGQYAYLACGFGIVKLNVKDAEISESYMLGFPVTAVTTSNDILYAKSNTDVWKGSTKSNLIDPSNWSKTDSYPPFDNNTTDYDNNIDLVKTLKPGGPDYNSFFEAKFLNGKLYTTGGAFRSGFVQLNNPGTVQIYDGNNWTVYPIDINKTTGFNYQDINCIDVDPTDNNRVMVAGRCGLYEFYNGVLKTYYYKDNSPLRPPYANYAAREYMSNDYTLIHGIKFDNNGNLWVLNSQTREVNLLMLDKEGQWTKHTNTDLYYNTTTTMPGLRCPMFDSRGLLWFVNTHYYSPSILCYNTSNDQLYKYESFINQDGTSYENCYPYDVKEDISGNIWIATTKGPFIIKKEEVGQTSVTLYQEKVPRNDGTNYADYLLTGLPCNCIAIDKAGRKWIGTTGSGVFLISEDNMTQLQHFTTDNSCILSDNIQYISINQQSGEVFFLTDKGLCSYVADATEAATEMTKETVWAYPNPVTPEYTGLITVVGLTLNADVKILSANGKLVAEGRSNGGTFTWDGNDQSGNRVASGVYMVATATKSGEKGTVCKIAVIR